MARKKLLHIRSNVVENGAAKLPTSDQIEYGEIAINFADEYETLSIKNSNDEIVKFSNDSYFEKIISEDEKTTAAALNDLDERKADKSEITDLISGVTISGVSIVENNVADIPIASASGYGVVMVDDELDSGSTNPIQNKVLDAMLTKIEMVTSTALNDLDERKADKTDIPSVGDYFDGVDYNSTNKNISFYNGETLKDSVNVNDFTFVDDVEISGISIVNDRVASIPIASNLDYGVVMVDEVMDSASTNPVSNAVVTKTILDDEKVMAASLNDIEERKADKTDIPNVSIYFDDAQYNSTNKTIEFYNNNVLKDSIDATAFIKDGMVNSVAVDDVSSGGTTVKCLVITFNTDAGKEDINIPISDIFDSDLYYTKTESDTKYGKVDDITFSGTSIVSNKVAAFNVATSSAYGLVKVDLEMDKNSINPLANSAVTVIISEDEKKITFKG